MKLMQIGYVFDMEILCRYVAVVYSFVALGMQAFVFVPASVLEILFEIFTNIWEYLSEVTPNISADCCV